MSERAPPGDASGVLQLRPARKSECRTIARLYAISSDGVSEYVWTREAQAGEDILDVGQRRYEREDSVFSYKNCTLAVLGDAIAGMMVAFPVNAGDAPSAPDPDPVLAPYAQLEVRPSFYVCGVALFPEYRGRGIGGRMMACAEERARALKFRQLSLVVFERNTAAARLYARLGYRERARAAIVPHPLIRCRGDAVLLVKAI